MWTPLYATITQVLYITFRAEVNILEHFLVHNFHLAVEMKSTVSKFVVLDIDGVLLRGGSLIDGATKSIQRLIEHKIPYVFVTNGGGMTEAKKAQDLSKKVGIAVLESQVVLSHTPFKDLKSDFARSRVLVIGGQPRCVEVAKSYGFEKAISIADYHAEHKNVYPLRDSAVHMDDSAVPEPVEAVMVSVPANSTIGTPTWPLASGALPMITLVTAANCSSRPVTFSPWPK